MANAQEDLVVSGMEGGWDASTPNHELLQLVVRVSRLCQEQGSIDALRYSTLSGAGVWCTERLVHCWSRDSGVSDVSSLSGGRHGLDHVCFIMLGDSRLCGRPANS